MDNQPKIYDTIIIGGGIAGQESALNLAKSGHKVLMVEKDLSLGGKMIHLSKVFPTLDCSACITTPKVSETARHPNIELHTNSEIKSINKQAEQKFKAVLQKNPRYVIESACTGCQDCEEKCPVVVEDQYQYDLVGRKAVYVPFSIANPRVAAIDIENCILCGACEKACPADAIDFTQKVEYEDVEARSVVIASGYNLFDAEFIERYGYGKHKNVVTSMQMERQLVPTRPYNTVLRPKDGKMPDNIAYVLCAGSRDETVGNKICSQVCCMYSIKQAQLLMGALPMADITIYYLHIRAFGKGFEEFYQQAKAMGVEFVKAKIGKIDENEDGDLLTYSFKPHKKGYLRVFVFTSEDAYQVFPNEYERSVLLNPEKQESYRFPQHVDIILESEEDSETHRMVFVFLKENIPYTGEVSYKDIFDWIFSIAMDQRKIKTFSFAVTNGGS